MAVHQRQVRPEAGNREHLSGPSGGRVGGGGPRGHRPRMKLPSGPQQGARGHCPRGRCDCTRLGTKTPGGTESGGNPPPTPIQSGALYLYKLNQVPQVSIREKATTRMIPPLRHWKDRGSQGSGDRLRVARNEQAQRIFRGEAAGAVMTEPRQVR